MKIEEKCIKTILCASGYLNLNDFVYTCDKKGNISLLERTTCGELEYDRSTLFFLIFKIALGGKSFGTYYFFQFAIKMLVIYSYYMMIQVFNYVFLALE